MSWSPCFHYLDMHWLLYLRQAGYRAQLSLDQAGFYPQGGGRVTATIRPVTQLSALKILRRGALQRISGVSAVANLKLSIADRQKRQALNRLQALSWESGSPQIKIKTVQLPSRVKGTLLLLMAEFEEGRCCYSSLGELGKPAERVADEAVDALEAFLSTDGAVDQYLADQLLLPLCLAKDVSEFRTSQVTQHLITNAEVAQIFISTRIDIQGELGKPGLIRITPA